MTGKYNLFGNLNRDLGNAQHAHLIPVTLEDRIQIAESDIKALTERVTSLEKMLDD